MKSIRSITTSRNGFVKYLYRTNTCIIILVSLLWTIPAKTQDYKSTFTDAEYYYLFQDYKEALPLYQKLYEQNKTNANLNYRIGMCYLNIPGLKQKSIPYLEFATKRINQHYQEGSYREQGAPSISFFYLGEAYMVNNQLDQAIESFQLFRDQLDIQDVYNLDFVDQQIKACELAKEMMKEPVKITTTKANEINIQGKECNYPIISGNMKVMAFTAKEKFYDGIFYCKFENGQWTPPFNITLDIVAEGEIYSTSLNNDGTQMLIFKNEKTDGNIYLSKYVNGRWTKAERLNKNINSKDWETFASFSPDEKTIFITSNRKGGFGGLDIYYSTIQPDGEWGELVNLGDNINTTYNEESPVLSQDSKTLYFSSQGHNNMGGFDVFYSKKLDNGSWSIPVNMGYPINTTDDDVFYFPIDSTSALISLVSIDFPGIKENFKLGYAKQQVNPDIIIKGKLLVADNRDIVSDMFSIAITETKSGKLMTKTKPKQTTGEFNTTVKPGTYNIEIKANGYETQNRNKFTT